jgi:hypothetical protein
LTRAAGSNQAIGGIKVVAKKDGSLHGFREERTSSRFMPKIFAARIT